MGNLDLNKHVTAISPSLTLGITQRANELKNKGVNVFSFAAGEPDCDTPQHIKDAAVKALAGGKTKYTATDGLIELRQAIVAKLQKDNGLTYKPSQIVVSNGAKHSLLNTFLAILNDGDEVIIPSPFWLSYPEMIKIAGGKSVFLKGRAGNDYKITPDEFQKAITPRTKAIVINSPSNPTGVIYTRKELEGLAAVAVKNGVYVISDEIYEKLVYEGQEHVSIGSLSKEILDLTITINGFSKVYSMTGWRLGYLGAPAKVADAISALQSHGTSGPNTFAQYGALEALKGPQGCVEEMRLEFDKRRLYIYNRLNAMKGVKCIKPMGAFYVFCDISSFKLDSITFSEKLLVQEGVAVVPGVSFDADEFIRFSYACSMDNITGGLDKFEKFVKSL